MAKRRQPASGQAVHRQPSSENRILNGSVNALRVDGFLTLSKEAPKRQSAKARLLKTCSGSPRCYLRWAAENGTCVHATQAQGAVKKNECDE